MIVKDVMHKNIVCVGIDTPLAKLARTMRDENIGAVPVLESENLVGIVTDRDACCRGLGSTAGVSKLTAEDVMTKPVHVCRENDELETALNTMRVSKVRRLPVMDANDNLCGMLTLDDVVEKSGMILAGNALRVLAVQN